jgi:hypothetical protein
VGVTVVLITCTYHGQEFIRVGYYVNNEYPDPELRENPPPKPDFSQVGPVSALCALDRPVPLQLRGDGSQGQSRLTGHAVSAVLS